MQFLLSKSLRHLGRLYSKAVIKTLPELYLEHHVDIILLLASGKGFYTKTELSEILFLDKSRIAILIKGLNQSGLVSIDKNIADKREHFVFLTEKGKGIIPEIQQAIDRVNALINQQLERTQLDCFYATLIRMELNFQKK